MARSPLRRVRPKLGLRLVIGVALGLAIAVPAQALAGAHAAATRHVVIKDYVFRPASLSIHAGDSVTWLFEDGSVSHNVTGHSFHSPRVQRRGSYTVRFTRRGSFSYVCSLHPWMTGRISVH